MVGELPKLPNDTIQPYMHDKTDVCEHTWHAYKRVVKIKQKTKSQLSNKTYMYIKCTYKTWLNFETAEIYINETAIAETENTNKETENER